MQNLITTILLLFSTCAYAQVCTSDPNATGLFYPSQPDSTASQFQSYEQTFTITVPTDTNVSVITVYIDSIYLDSVGGLPDGLTYACNSTVGNCSFYGGTQGCFIVSGTVIDAIDTYPITFNITLYGSMDPNGLEPIVSPYTIDIYNLYVDDGTVNIQPHNLSTFQLFPNPASTDLTLTTPTTAQTDYTIYDLSGRALRTGSFMKNITIPISDFAAGAYIVELVSEEGSSKQKFIKQ